MAAQEDKQKSRKTGSVDNEAALAWEIQFSRSVVVDPDTDSRIGAVTIGLDPSVLVDTAV